MTIDLINWEAKIVLEALRRLDAEWNAIMAGTDDEDIKSEYANDLGQLEIVHQRIDEASRAEFGAGVSTFSREEL